MNKNAVNKLKKIVGEKNVSELEKILALYSHDASSHKHSPPDVVVWPENTQQISKILRFAHEHHIAVTPYAKGSSLEGNPIPVKGGILLNMMKMNRIIKIYKDDFQVTVEPSIIGDVLNQQLEKHNLYFPSFPASSAFATIGGMIANNAGGMYAVKYGVVGDWVMELEVVLPTGIVMKVGCRSIKSVAGYDLKSLFIGSEGTLGIITMATLKLIPSIKNKVLFVMSFGNVKKAMDATVDILKENIDPSAVEFLDDASIKYVNREKHTNWKEASTLIIELQGEEAYQKNKIHKIENIAKKYQSLNTLKALTKEDMDAVWNIRKNVHGAIMSAFKNTGILPGDIGVPISQIPNFIKKVKETSLKMKREIAIFGHAGDGNFHVWIVYDRTKKETLEAAKKLSEKLIDIALQLDGTCTAEHGIGIGKRQFLKLEHPSSIEMMKRIKLLFDPHEILNPGKIF